MIVGKGYGGRQDHGTWKGDMDHQIDSNLTAQTKRRYNRNAPYYDVLEVSIYFPYLQWLTLCSIM